MYDVSCSYSYFGSCLLIVWQLALIQTNRVISMLQNFSPSLKFEIGKMPYVHIHNVRDMYLT